MSESAPLVDLRSDHWKVIRDLLQIYVPDRRVLAFGSRATWTAKEYSDLDLVVLGDEPLTHEVFAALSEGFQDSELPFKVDLVEWSQIDEKLRSVIRRDGVVMQSFEGVRELIGSNSATVASSLRTPRTSTRLDWRSLPLSEAVVVNPSIRLKRGQSYSYVDMASLNPSQSSVRAVSCREFKGGGSRFQTGDTLMARITPCLENGKIARFDSSTPGTTETAHGSTEFLVFRGRPGFSHSPFVNYLARSPIVREFAISQMTGTSGRQRVPTRSFDHLRVLLPPLSEQRDISCILSRLDDKIELNRRMNETLEAMAKAIFKDWFVDFGPVRAKMERRKPYLPSELWSSFPKAFDDKGKPVGWEIKPLDEVADFTNGLALQKFPAMEDDNESLPVLKIAELRGGVTARSGRASRLVPSNYVIVNGDFLFSWSGSLLAKFWTGGEAALNQHLFKVTSDRFPAWFYSQWVYHHLKEFQTIAATKATTMGHIKREHLKQAVVTCPPDNVIATLGRIIEPLITRTIKNSVERSTLANTRDLLLPKLVSGEIRIKDAETIVGQVL